VVESSQAKCDSDTLKSQVSGNHKMQMQVRMQTWGEARCKVAMQRCKDAKMCKKNKNKNKTKRGSNRQGRQCSTPASVRLIEGAGDDEVVR
jgi:hypothetical protein